MPTETIGKFLESAKAYIVPMALTFLAIGAAWQNLKSDTQAAIVANARQDAILSVMQTESAARYNELISIKAQANEWHSMISQRFEDLDKRFARIDSQLENINTTLRAMLIADNGRKQTP